MDTDRLNRWLTLAANVGVILGIVFVAYELRQNSELMRAQSRTAMAQDVVHLLTLNVNDTTYMETIYRGLRGEELTELEHEQFYRAHAAWIWHWNNLAYLHRVGLYDDAEYALQIDVIRGDLSEFPGHRKFWCENRQWIASPQLIEAIEGASDDNFCEPGLTE